MQIPQSNLRGALLSLAAFGVYATHDAVIKVLGASYSPLQIVFFATLLGFPLATLMLMRDRMSGNLVPRYPGLMAVRSLTVVTSGVGAFYAFSVLPLAQTYAILFATPLLITVLAIPVLGERVGLRRAVAVLVGLAGVLIVLRPGHGALGLGHAAALVAAGSSALGSVVVRRIGQQERAIVLMLYPMMANFALTGLAMPFVYVPMPAGDLMMLTFVAICAFVAMLLVIAAYRAGEAAVVAPMQYSQILWAVLFGALIFDEMPDLATAVGAAVVIASGLYIVMRESQAEVSGTTPVLTARARIETGTMPRIGAPADPPHGTGANGSADERR